MPTRPTARLLFPALLAPALALAPLLGADKPDADALPEVSQETKTDIKFTVQAKADAKEPRFAIARVRKGDKDVDVPKNMKLDAESGTFTWTPTPSQAGVYDVKFTTKSGDEETAATCRITVKERAISAANGPVGDLLRKWHKEGTAAGNTGDFYDNRDRDHSALNLAPYPQLDVVTYTPEDRKANRDWAMQVVTHKEVTFGNSSTSAPVLASGSNVRSYYAHPRGLAFLYEQYRGNNLYMYPAHHDHHPGHNGTPFYGDVFPANSPYLITSQGSSGSDQPFMNAVPKTLAAFRPDVKRKLIESGLLMPTVQMILRSSNKHIKEPKEYLTGKAHPPVFEGSWGDEQKMVQAAHDIELKTIPPMIQLKVVEEDAPVAGRDMFDGPLTETLGESPAAVARVVRGGKRVRRMVVSAEESFDVNKNALTFHWSVLRGDKERITIKPLNESGSKVELLVGYHERRPVADAPLKIESNRVDIGAFVHNGTYYSAPGFVTFFYLDNESRTYDDKGRLLERGYGFGETELAVSDWKALFLALRADGDSFGTQLLKKPHRAEELAVLARAEEEYDAASADVVAAQARSKLANEQRQRVADLVKKGVATKEELQREEAVAQAAQKDVDAANKRLADVLSRKRDGLELPVKETLERTLARLRDDPNFASEHRAALAALLQKADAGTKARVAAARKRLFDLGILAAGDDFRLQPLRDGKEPAAGRLTAYEKSQVERFNGELLAALVYPKIVSANYKVNFADQRLFTAKPWRDVYHYDTKGNALGWTRHDGADQWDFNADGQVILERDEHGRPRRTRTVTYEFDDPKKNVFQSPMGLKYQWGGEVLHYEYAGDDDTTGRVARREPVAAAK